MSENNLKIAFVIFGCVVIAISNQVLADDVDLGSSNQQTAVLESELPVIKESGEDKSLAIEERRLKEAEERSKKEGNILRGEPVQLGPQVNVDQGNGWPKK